MLVPVARAYGDVSGYALGTEISDSSFTASSSIVGYEPVSARYEKLNYLGWRPAVSNPWQWLQVTGHREQS